MTVQTATLATTSAMTTEEAAETLRVFLADMRGEFADRDNETRGILIALIARGHIFFGGPPGTAKSAMVNAFAKASGKSYFARLLMRQSVPEELFGPTDLLALRDGRYERRTEGYLPTADFAFIDECFKASPSILNTLLTIMNERVFDQGASRIKVPLELLAGASNELPQDASLAALWDRFLLRFWVNPISDKGLWEKVMFADEPGANLSLDPEALRVIRIAADSVNARPIAKHLIAIKDSLEERHEITASDRRWKQSIRSIKASAALAGRTEATGADLMILADCLWNKPNERSLIFGIIAENANPELTKALKLSDAAREIIRDLDLKSMSTKTPQPNDAVKLSAANSEVRRLCAQVEELPATSEIAPIQAEIKAWSDEITRAGMRAMGLDR